MVKRLRHIIFILFIFTSTLSANAETVRQSEAARIAEKFFNAMAGQVMAKPKYVYNGKNLTTKRLFTPFYVYNHPAGGSVIISAENKAMPILGYSRKSNLSPDHINQELKDILSGYAKEIEYIRYDSRIPDNAIGAWGDIADNIDYSLNRFYQDNDLLRLETEEGDTWIMRRNATEFPDLISASGQEPDMSYGQEQEEEPFTFYDSFIAETKAEQQRRLDSFDAKLNILEPQLRWIGGGHFEVRLPENVCMVRVYNMEGALLRQLTFRNTDTAIFDLDSEPMGFYFAIANDVNGHPYGFKIYK